MLIIKNIDKNLIVEERLKFDGYCLPTKSNSFNINGTAIKNIIIINKVLARPFVSKIVRKKYKKLIDKLTDLLISDDDTGAGIIEILNMIEKFKQEIKIKYRKYLKKKELEEMANKLKFIRQKALDKQIMLQSYYMNNTKASNRSR